MYFGHIVRVNFLYIIYTVLCSYCLNFLGTELQLHIKLGNHISYVAVTAKIKGYLTP